MLTNTERQQIVEEVNAGTYGIDEALDDIAAAQKGEEVRKALYAEALVLNREGHAGSTDMIARQQVANLQTSVNGQISTLRTEVGEDIDDLETALNSGLATQNGRIAAQDATIANVVANYNVEYGSTELWASTGETGALAAGTTVTLSEDVSHFDYIDIYSFCGNSNVLDTVPVDAKLQSNAGYALRWVNLSDPGSGSYKAYVRIIETRLHIIGTTLTIDHQVTYRNGEEVNISGAEITQSNRSTYMGELGIMKIVGRKITANTEVTDIRVGADGTTYNSAGAAVRAQVTALESAIPAVDSTLSTQGAAADAKAAGDKVAELKSAIDFNTKKIDNALINSSGVIESTNVWDCYCYKVAPGSVLKHIEVQTASVNLVYAFYGNSPVMGSTSYNGGRTIAPNNELTADNVIIPESANWIVIKSSKTDHPIVTYFDLNDISVLDRDIADFANYGVINNGIDNIPVLPTRTDSGITFSTSGRTYNINGTATADTFINVYVNETGMPSWCEAGGKYYFGIDGNISNLKFCVYLYKGEQYTILDMLKIQQPYSIPDDITGILIRIRVATGKKYTNQVIYPYVTSQTPYNLLKNECAVYYVGASRTGANSFKTLKAVSEYISAHNIKGATVHVDGEVFDLVTEYTDEFAGMTASDETNVYYGLRFGNRTNYIFHGSKIKFNYTGSNNSVKAHFSPINIVGSCYIDGLDLECSNCRYGIHDDKAAEQIADPLKVEYRNCKVSHNGSNYINTDYWVPAAIGAGVLNGDLRIIDNCHLIINADQTRWGIGVHNAAYTGYAKVIISNTYCNGQLVLRNISSSISSPGYYSVMVTNSKFDLGITNKDETVITVTVLNEAEEVENKLKPYFELADGDMDSFITTDDADKAYVASHVDDAVQVYHVPYMDKILAINHDDLAPSDYLGTWKIYNKFGYRANFNIIVAPFATKAIKEQKIEAVKKMAESGHEFGLHAVLNQSYWTMNKMYDIRPNLSRTFAPALVELTDPVEDNKNVFGADVSSTVSNCGLFADPPSSIASTVLSALSANNWHTLFNQYTLLSSEDRYTGLDLGDAQQSYTALQWIEYWYNTLIDNTIGYSRYRGVKAFYRDAYDIGIDTSSMTDTERIALQESYYPTASEIITGQYVFYDDVSNPNYSNYHKVGRFTKGLFKGCATTCNFEVIDRIIDAAKAFCRHYYMIEQFTNYSRHGVRFSKTQWVRNGLYYDDRDFTVMGGDYGRFYSLRHKRKESERDIFIRHGITNLAHPPVSDPRPTVFGQIGLYYGQHNIRSPYLGGVERFRTGYLSFFGTSGAAGNEDMDADTYHSYTDGIDNLLKYAYENAGGTISNGTSTKTVYTTIRDTLDNIRATFGTGKIPFFSFDTIRLNAADMAAVHMLAEYCYKNDIKIVPIETARRIAETSKRTGNNLFANPGFRQSTLDMFGGSSTAGNAYLPDGWVAEEQLSNGEITVSIDNGIRKMIVEPSGEYIILAQYLYGIEPGTYRFSIYGQGAGTITVYLARNSDKFVPFSNLENVGTITFTSTDSEQHLDFAIPEFYNIPVDGASDDEIITGGYANNVCCVIIRLIATDTLSVHNPKIILT